MSRSVCGTIRLPLSFSSKSPKTKSSWYRFGERIWPDFSPAKLWSNGCSMARHEWGSWWDIKTFGHFGWCIKSLLPLLGYHTTQDTMRAFVVSTVICDYQWLPGSESDARWRWPLRATVTVNLWCVVVVIQYQCNRSGKDIIVAISSAIENSNLLNLFLFWHDFKVIFIWYTKIYNIQSPYFCFCFAEKYQYRLRSFNCDCIAISLVQQSIIFFVSKTIEF